MLEFVDKLIIVRNFRLLALVGFALYLQIFKLLLPVLRVIAGISVQTAIFKLINTSRNRIKKRPPILQRKALKHLCFPIWNHSGKDVQEASAIPEQT